MYFSQLWRWGEEAKVKVQADWVSGESPLPGLHMAHFLLCADEAERERGLMTQRERERERASL